MAKQLQLRRGSMADHENFTGAVGELTYATDAKTVVVHDGETVGGIGIVTYTDLWNMVDNGQLGGGSSVPFLEYNRTDQEGFGTPFSENFTDLTYTDGGTIEKNEVFANATGITTNFEVTGSAVKVARSTAGYDFNGLDYIVSYGLLKLAMPLSQANQAGSEWFTGITLGTNGDGESFAIGWSHEGFASAKLTVTGSVYEVSDITTFSTGHEFAYNPTMVRIRYKNDNTVVAGLALDGKNFVDVFTGSFPTAYTLAYPGHVIYAKDATIRTALYALEGGRETLDQA